MLVLGIFAAILLVFEFGLIVTMEATVVYFTLMALAAITSYVAMVKFLRKMDMLSGWRIAILAAVIFFGSIFEVWLLAILIRPWIASQSGMILAKTIEPAFMLYALIGTIMLIFSAAWAVESAKREKLEKIKSSINVSLVKNSELMAINFGKW